MLLGGPVYKVIACLTTNKPLENPDICEKQDLYFLEETISNFANFVYSHYRFISAQLILIKSAPYLHQKSGN